MCPLGKAAHVEQCCIHLGSSASSQVLAPKLLHDSISITERNVGGDYHDGSCILGGEEQSQLG
jgi:hypothetical protein